MSFRNRLFIPLVVFVVLVAFLGLGFGLKDPHLLPSVLIDKPLPRFRLVDLHDAGRTRSREDLLGEICLLNVWATWCPNCVVEHPELMRISQDEDVPLYGINYNDNSEKARAWLRRFEDPYRFSVVDDEGTLAIDLGVYGAPETFVVDASGVIRFRHVGPVNSLIWRDQILPVIKHLRRGDG